MRALAIAAVLLVAAPAGATKLRYPSTCHSGCMVVSAYFDLGGTKDWGCGKNTYAGHKGTDFAIIGRFTAMDAGRDIVAAAEGNVVDAHDGEFDRCTTANCAGGGGYGNYVKLQHPDGKLTYYAHMRKGTVAVGKGAHVNCGQKLGQVGSSGYSTGPHLHFEVRVNNAADDPFGGHCGGPLIYWVDQGGYNGLPSQSCEGPPPPPPDMAVPPPPPDMTVPPPPPDMTVLPDLVVPPDLALPPDLAEGPDLLNPTAFMPDGGEPGEGGAPGDGPVARDAGLRGDMQENVLEGGCTCRATRRASPPWLLFALPFVLLLRRRR